MPRPGGEWLGGCGDELFGGEQLGGCGEALDVGIMSQSPLDELFSPSSAAVAYPSMFFLPSSTFRLTLEDPFFSARLNSLSATLSSEPLAPEALLTLISTSTGESLSTCTTIFGAMSARQDDQVIKTIYTCACLSNCVHHRGDFILVSIGTQCTTYHGGWQSKHACSIQELSQVN